MKLSKFKPINVIGRDASILCFLFLLFRFILANQNEIQALSMSVEQRLATN